MALDLACGAGQGTFELCNHYQQTVGVDISKAQIERAQEKAIILGNTEVEFVHAAADDLPFRDASIDLLTCAMSWHWLNPNTVFPEIDRVLNSPGALAVYSYCIPTISRHEQCNKMFQDFIASNSSWYEDSQYGPVFGVLENHYENIKLPLALSERHCISVESERSLEWVRGYIMSLNGFDHYCLDHPEARIALDDLMQDMKTVLTVKDSNKVVVPLSDVTVNMTYFMLLAVKC